MAIKPSTLKTIGGLLLFSSLMLGGAGYFFGLGGAPSVPAGAVQTTATVTLMDPVPAAEGQMAKTAVALKFADAQNAPHTATVKVDECCTGDLAVGSTIPIHYQPSDPTSVTCVLPGSEKKSLVSKLLLSMAGFELLAGIALLAVGLANKGSAVAPVVVRTE